MLTNMPPAACCCYWLACSDIMLVNKATGKANWYHPASLTSGGRYANGSAAMRCIQAASGMLASCWHMYTSRRQAEGKTTQRSAVLRNPNVSLPLLQHANSKKYQHATNH